MNFLEKILLTAGLVAVHNTAEASFTQKVEKPQRANSSMRAAHADILSDMEIIRQVVAKYKKQNPKGHIKSIEDALKPGGEFDKLNMLANERIYSKKTSAPADSFIRCLAQILMTEYRDGPGDVFVPGNEADIGKKVESKSVLSAQFTQRFGSLVQTLSEHLKKELGMEKLPFERSKFMAVTVKDTSSGINENAVAGMAIDKRSDSNTIQQSTTGTQMNSKYAAGALLILGTLGLIFAMSSSASDKKQKQEQRKKQLEENATLKFAISNITNPGIISSDLISYQPKGLNDPEAREFSAIYFIPNPGNPSHGTINIVTGNWQTVNINQYPSIIEEAIRLISEIHLSSRETMIDRAGEPTQGSHVEVRSSSRAQVARLIKEADTLARQNS